MSDAGSKSPGVAAVRDGAFSLANHFLIAMPGMADPGFSGGLVYLCEHTPQGALGVMVNRPIDLTLQALFERVELKLDREDMSEQPVLYGGPVQIDRGFVLHDDLSAPYDSTLRVEDGLALTMSKDVLQAVADGGGPKRLLVTRGYSGWGEGQLEQEISANAWLTVLADPSVIFDLPANARFGAAMALLGIDPAMLSDQAGHA
jgi:putative transcriptional regulator